jgi:hypothetical protein
MRRQEGETPCRRPGRMWTIRHLPARGVAQAAFVMLPKGTQPHKGYLVARRRRTAAVGTVMARPEASSKGRSSLKEDKSRVTPGRFAGKHPKGPMQGHKGSAEPDTALVGILIKLYKVDQSRKRRLRSQR